MGRIAFIGLGAMGAPMAARLARRGDDVCGFDRAKPACARAAAEGVATGASIEAAAAGASVVVTMLQSGAQVLDVWRAALPHATADALFIDCSTIDVESARSAHDCAGRLGRRSLDAPVSGGVAGACAGSLTFMCGGDPTTFAAAKPILDIMGARTIHCGGPGLGQAAKLCNNLMLGVTMIATAEAFSLAQKLGLPALTLFDVASASSGQSWSLTHYCPVAGLAPAAPSNQGFEGGFATKLMLKDLRLADKEAAGAGAVTPLCAAAAQLYALFEAQGGGDKDFSGVIALFGGKSRD